MLSPREITPESLRGSVREALQACAVNVADRGVWIERLADHCGIDVRTVQGHFYGETGPSLPHFMRYVAKLGPAFASRVLEPAGVACIHRGDLRAVNSAEVLNLARQAGRVIKNFGEDIERAARDGGGE